MNDIHYYTHGQLTIRAQKEADGYYHLYSLSLGYLDEYWKIDKLDIKRFRSIDVGRKTTEKFLKSYIKEIQKELKQLKENER